MIFTRTLTIYTLCAGFGSQAFNFLARMVCAVYSCQPNVSIFLRQLELLDDALFLSVLSIQKNKNKNKNQLPKKLKCKQEKFFVSDNLDPEVIK